MSEQRQRDSFGRLGFILAAAGSAVGLGNIWKFPYITYENQGGSFVLVYLLAVATVGAPVMVAEIVVGRRARRNPVGAFADLSEESGGRRTWGGVGWLGVAAGYVILSYYAIVAGWAVHYMGLCLKWSVQGFTPALAASLGTAFEQFVGNGPLQILYQGLFMCITMAVVVLGVKAGIERFSKLLLPALFLLLVALCVAASQWPGFSQAIGFLFHLGPIQSSAILEAVGHAFFTLSLGMGAMVTYGSYVAKSDSIPKAGMTVCLLDTLIALMACVVMFSIIFSVPEAERATTFARSAAILFTTLPRMFYALPGGAVMAPSFYLLVAFAALTSTISLLEVVVSYFIDQRRWSRTKATLIVGGCIFLGGIPSALSNGSVAKLAAMSGRSFFAWADYLASNWMLPVGGLLVAVFVGWRLRSDLIRAEIEEGHGKLASYGTWHFLVRFVCPLAIVAVFVHVVFLS